MEGPWTVQNNSIVRLEFEVSIKERCSLSWEVSAGKVFFKHPCNMLELDSSFYVSRTEENPLLGLLLFPSVHPLPLLKSKSRPSLVLQTTGPGAIFCVIFRIPPVAGWQNLPFHGRILQRSLVVPLVSLSLSLFPWPSRCSSQWDVLHDLWVAEKYFDASRAEVRKNTELSHKCIQLFFLLGAVESYGLALIIPLSH